MATWDESGSTPRKRRFLQSSARGGGGGGGGSYTQSSSFTNNSQSPSRSSLSQQSFTFSPSFPTTSGSTSTFTRTSSTFSSSSPSSQDWHIKVSQQLGRLLHGIISYLLDLLFGTMMILRPLLSFILAISILAICFGALTRGISNIKTEIQLRVVCKIPLASYLMDCSPNYRDNMMYVPNFSDLIKKQEDSYAVLVESLNSFSPSINPKQNREYYDEGSSSGNGGGRDSDSGRSGKKMRKRDKVKRFFSRFKKRKEDGRNSGGNDHEKSREPNDSGKGDSENKPVQKEESEKIEEGEEDKKYDVDGDEDDEDYELDHFGLTTASSRRLPLSLIIKQSELAVVDLKVLVKHSGLSEDIKSLLIEHLQSYHIRAKATSRQIQSLQSRANGCLDGLAIRNVYLRIELDRLDQGRRLLETRGASTGLWGFMDRLLDAFIETSVVDVKDSERQLLDLYKTTMDEAQTHIHNLIIQAQEVLQSLYAMDNNLLAIHDIVTRETKAQHRHPEDILAQVWAHLGGFRVEKELYRSNLKLLKGLGGKRKRSVGQIQNALRKLEQFEIEIGFLREKVVDASVSSTEDLGPLTTKGSEDSGSKRLGTLSLKVHIQQIDKVTDRLKGRSFLYDTEAQENRVTGFEDGV